MRPISCAASGAWCWHCWSRSSKERGAGDEGGCTCEESSCTHRPPAGCTTCRVSRVAEDAKRDAHCAQSAGRRNSAAPRRQHQWPSSASSTSPPTQGTHGTDWCSVSAAVAPKLRPRSLPHFSPPCATSFRPSRRPQPSMYAARITEKA